MENDFSGEFKKMLTLKILKFWNKIKLQILICIIYDLSFAVFIRNIIKNVIINYLFLDGNKLRSN